MGFVFVPLSVCGVCLPSHEPGLSHGAIHSDRVHLQHVPPGPGLPEASEHQSIRASVSCLIGWTRDKKIGWGESQLPFKGKEFFSIAQSCQLGVSPPVGSLRRYG